MKRSKEIFISVVLGSLVVVSAVVFTKIVNDRINCVHLMAK